MNARWKTILVAASGFAGVLLAILALNQWVIQPAFKRLEQSHALEDGERTRQVIADELQQLDRLLQYWSEQHDIRAFIAHRDPAFIRAQFDDWQKLERTLHLNFSAIADRSGRILYQGGYDSELGGDFTLTAFFGPAPSIQPYLQTVLASEQPRLGLLNTEQGLLLLASRPLLTTQDGESVQGVLVFGRRLNASLLRSLAARTQVAFELLPSNDSRLSPVERDYFRTLQPGEAAVRPGPDGTPFVYRMLTDLADRPAALIRVPVWQEISATAAHTGHTLISVLGLAALLTLLTGAYLFSRFGPGSAPTGDTVAWITALLTILIGSVLTTGLFLEARQQSEDALAYRFQRSATEKARFLIKQLEDSLRYLDVVKQFFTTSEYVSRAEFHRFVTPILEYSGFQAIEWLPRVTGAQRAEFERAARQDGLTDFQFTEPGADDAVVRAAERDEYFPVYYLEPLAGNRKALGFSPAPSHPARGAVLVQARDSGQIALSERYILVQDLDRQPSVLAFDPVYETTEVTDTEQRRQRLKGFVLGVIRIGDLVDKTLPNTKPQGLILRLVDLSAEQDQQLLFASSASPDLPQTTDGAILHYQQNFPLADRWWRIDIQPDATFLARNTERAYRWIPVTGILITALASLYLFTVVSQRRRAEALVMARTAELRAAHQYTQTVLDTLSDTVFVNDARSGRIIDVNRRMSEMYGYSREEALTLQVGQLSLGTPPYSHDEAWAWLSKAREEGPQTFEWVAKRRSGEMFWVEVNVRFTTIDQRERFVISVRDIAERKAAEQALRASEDKFRRIVENAPLGFHLYRLEANDRLVFIDANLVADAILKIHHADLVGRSIEEAFPSLVHTEIPAIYRRLARDGGVQHWDYVRYRHAALNGDFEVTAFQTAPGMVAIAFIDITERRRTAKRQRLATAVFEAAREAIVVTNAKGHIVAVNPAAVFLSGYTETELLGQSVRKFQFARPAMAYYHAIRQAVARDGGWQGEVRVRCRDGQSLLLVTVSTVRDEANPLSHYVIIATDITRQKEAERRIEHLAYYDALTDLPNRALLAQRAELALALAARRHEEVAVMFLDLDRFKDINDSLGHAEGDELLVQVAHRLRQLIRETDTVCRLGGDEFVLLLPDTGQTGAAHLAKKLLTGFRQPYTVGGHHLQITTSVGIALYPHDGATFTELLKNADAALYQTKQEGRDDWMFYTREMNVATFERLLLESQLRKAIGREQLCAYFQPKIRLDDGRLAGAEALIRWLHPEHGLIPPQRFIAVAEASDLIVELGDWMLAEACRQLVAWRAMGLPLVTISVNLAARHFRDPGFIDRIDQLLVAHDLTAALLELELTESSLLEIGARMTDTLSALERLGVGLAVDDFGTGYSNLNYLKHLPLTALKIDQSFVRNLVSDPDDRTLGATIIALGHNLGLQVVAEGVETEEQRRILLEQGCDFAQGYLFDAPMPAGRFVHWLRSESETSGTAGETGKTGEAKDSD